MLTLFYIEFEKFLACSIESVPMSFRYFIALFEYHGHYFFLFKTFFQSGRCRLKRYPLQVRHKQDWPEGLSFYYSRLLYCLDQMLAVMLLSQHQVLSSKTVRPRAPGSARCIGHAVRTCLQFVQRRHIRNSVKERDPICAWMNGIAQQSAGG